MPKNVAHVACLKSPLPPQESRGHNFMVVAASFSMLATGVTALDETDALLCRDTLKLLSALKQKPIYGGYR